MRRRRRSARRGGRRRRARRGRRRTASRPRTPGRRPCGSPTSCTSRAGRGRRLGRRRRDDPHRGHVASGGSHRLPHDAAHRDEQHAVVERRPERRPRRRRRPARASRRRARARASVLTRGPCASTSAEPSISAPDVTTHVSAPSTVRTPGATLELQHRLRDRVHPVQVALRQQPAVRVHRQPAARARRAAAHQVTATARAARARALRGP